MNKSFLLPVFLMLYGFLLLESCKKEEPVCCDISNPECPNYDPCHNKTLANAEFTFGEVCVLMFGGGAFLGGPPVSYKDSIIFSDTIYWLNTVEFSVKQTDYDSLKWFIGSEILNTPTVRRKGFPINEIVQVQLIVFKTAESTCFPDAPNADTVVKTFYSAEFPVFYEKRYKGFHESAPNDTAIVSFNYPEPFGIPEECNQWPGAGGEGRYFMAYRDFVWTNLEIANGCVNRKALRITGYATDETFEANYTYISGDGKFGPWVEDHFIGKIMN